MASLPEDAATQLHIFQDTLKELGEDVQQMLLLTSKDSSQRLPPLKRSQAMLALANAVHALNMLLMRANGKDTSQVPQMHKEQERLAAYRKKVAKVVSADELSRARKTVELNVDAANRFISAAIPELTDEQRAALRAGNQAGKRKAESEAEGAQAPGTRHKGHQAPQDPAAAAAAAAGDAPSGKSKGKGKGKGKQAGGAGSVKDQAVAFIQSLMEQGASERVGTMEALGGEGAKAESDGEQ